MIFQHYGASYAGTVQGFGMYGGLQASWYDIVFEFSGIPGGM